MVQSYHIVYSNVFIDSPPFSTIALTFLITPGPIRTTLQSGDFHTMEKPTRRGGGGNVKNARDGGGYCKLAIRQGKVGGSYCLRSGNCMYLYSGKKLLILHKINVFFRFTGIYFYKIHEHVMHMTTTTTGGLRLHH